MTSTSSAIKGLLIAAAAASMAACATKKEPPPTPPIPPGASTAPDGSSAAPYGNGGDVNASPNGVAPGSERDFIVNAGDRVYFDLNEYNLTDDGRRVLDQQAGWLQRYGQVAVRIEGNCDERGTREYNLALGARRAEAVKAYLVSRGLSPARITTISYGKERPIDPGSGEDAYAKNRNGHTSLTGGMRVGATYQ